MGRLSLSSTPLLLLDLEELIISETLPSLSDLYEFARGIQSCSGEIGQVLVQAAFYLSLISLGSQIKRSFL